MYIWIDARSPYAFEKIYSITSIERILRQLHELGVRDGVTVMLLPEQDLQSALRRDFPPRYPLQFDMVETDDAFAALVLAAQAQQQSLMLLEGDGIYDERILTTLMRASDSLVIGDASDAASPLAAHLQPNALHGLKGEAASLREQLQACRADGLTTLSVRDMDSYIPALRRTATPFLARLGPGVSVRHLENEMYEQTFKGAMDFIATYIYRIPVRELVRWLAPTRVTPNHITAISVICSFGALALFAMNWLWLGLLVAFTFIIADSLDGKLARLTIRLSPAAGHVDHITSPLFESGYYIAWGWHLSAGDFTALPGLAGWFLFACFGLDRIVTSIFGLRFHRSLLDYKAWDARFHLIAARRTVNLFIMLLGLTVQQPVVALYIIAIWMCITMCWHIARYAVHAVAEAA